MKQRKKADWEQLVREYRNSGKSLRVWCDENGINHKTMCGYTHLVPAHNAKRSEKEWIDLINEKQASGMSREGWCRENEINPNSMLSAEKRLKTKLNSDSDMKESIDESRQMNTDITPCIISAESKWIEVNIDESPESELPAKRRHLPTTAIPATSSHGDILIKEENKSKETVLSYSKIVIRCGKLVIEADAGYPSECLENFIGKLAAVC